MQGEERRAVARLDLPAERMVVGHLAGIGVAVERACGRMANLPQPVLDAEPAMHLHRIRALLDAGADAGERLGLLVDDRLDEEFAQRGRNREPADAGADDRDFELLLVPPAA